MDAKHFNGGTINWSPINPYANASSVPITITQTYSWTYPYVKCANNVPVSSGWGSTNLICVVDCTSDGGYSSSQMITTSTDCISTSPALNMMTSQRSNNVTLTAGAHFYLAFVGNAWVPLNYPVRSNQEWSIVTFIDLRLRPDGFLNTPPVAAVVSPQYAIVNQTIQINIPVSDANAGDDVRCRWSTYTSGYRRRKRSENEESTKTYLLPTASICQTITTTVSTTTMATTTSETTGTLRSTSSCPVRQAINECGDICFPNSVPNGTTLNGCTISFTGTQAGVWYAVDLQVENFINTTSTVPMSSVPVQLLIYVRGSPQCSNQPLILPLNGCLEVQVNVPISFTIYAMNLCNPAVANISDIVPSSIPNGMTKGNLTNSSTNSSLSYIPFTWTPQASQIGYQELCVNAYTTEQLQSDQYCAVFTVKSTSELCVTTTTTIMTSTSTTSTTSTSTTSMTTSSSTSTTSSASKSTTTTSVTTTTATTVTTRVAPQSPINWPLIVGLSLLALLAGLCCCCYCLYRYCWSAAAKRYRKKDREVAADDSPFRARYLIDKARKSRAASGLFRASPLSKADNNYNSLCATDSINNTIQSDLIMSDMIKVDDDIDEARPTSVVLVTRVKRIDLDKTIKTEDNPEEKRTTSNVPHSANASVRVKKVSKLDIIQEEQQQFSNVETTSRSKSSRVNIMKIFRKKTSASQRNINSVIENGHITSSNEIAFEMQPVSNRSQTAVHKAHDRANLGSSVTVKKLSRTINSAQR